jgi:hypothetical protein
MDPRITSGPVLPPPTRPATPAPATPATPATTTPTEGTTPAQATGHVEGTTPTDNHGNHPTPTTTEGPHHQWVAQATGGVTDVTHPAGDVSAVFGREFDLGHHNHISLTGGYGTRGIGSGHTSHSLLAGAHMENPLFHVGRTNFVLESGVHGEYNFGHGFHLGGSLGMQYQIPLNNHGTQLNLRAGGTAGTDFHSVHPGGYGGVELDINKQWSVGAQVNLQEHSGHTVTGVTGGVTFRFGGGGGH